MNNVPNGVNFGVICACNGTTWALKGIYSVSMETNSGLNFQGFNTVSIGVQEGRPDQNTSAIGIGWQAQRTHEELLQKQLEVCVVKFIKFQIYYLLVNMQFK